MSADRLHDGRFRLTWFSSIQVRRPSNAMRILSHIILFLACSGLAAQAEPGTHEWVVRAPGGHYGLIQYDWVQSTTEDKVWPISEDTWPISPATHKARSFTSVYFAQRLFTVPLSA